MGMEEINSKMEDIIAFSELEGFIDQPFKTYSSGMQARLTFATAVSVEPEILILDEALSVGDVAFQRKCYAQMKKLRSSGATILLVSHDTNAVASFCDRAILMELGNIALDDVTKKVINAYYQTIYNEIRSQEKVVGTANKAKDYLQAVDSAPGTAARLTQCTIYNLEWSAVTLLESCGTYYFVLEACFYQNVAAPNWSLSFEDARGQMIYGNNTSLMNIDLPLCLAGTSGRMVFKCTLPLAAGTYFFVSGIGNCAGINYDSSLPGKRFDVFSHTPSYEQSIVACSIEDASESFPLNI
jgi:hypothetical protein